MGKRRKQTSDRGTFQRIWIGKSLRAPKGKRWTKPKAILDSLDSAVIKATLKGKSDPAHVANLRALRDFARGMLDRFGNRGNVYLEYAWSQFAQHGKCLDEQDVMVATTNGRLNRWYNSLCGGRGEGTVTSEKVMVSTNPDRLRVQVEQAKSAPPKVDKAKATGDAYRAEREAARQRRAKFAAEYKVEQAQVQAEKALMESLRRALKGA